jgi:hypothetical protein
MPPPIYYNQYIGASYFGVKANNVDMTTLLQEALDAATYTYKLNLLIDVPGRMDSPLQAGYGIDYSGPNISGIAKMYDAETKFVGTALDTRNNTSAMAINIQGGRNPVIENLGFIGPNDAYLKAANPLSINSKPSWDDTVWANWVDPALLVANANADSRYAPVACITVDAYGGNQPTPHYPTVAYLSPAPFEGNDISIGIANLSAPLNTYFAVDTNSMVLTGGIFGIQYNNAQVGTYTAPFAAGATLDVAVDTTNHKAWWRWTAAGASSPGEWLGSNAANNPATNLGGIDISGITGAIYPAFTLYCNAVNSGIVNLGGSPFLWPMPSGFTGVGGQWNPGDVTAGTVLSNGNLTATTGTTRSTYYDGRGTVAISGKKFFSFQPQPAAYSQYNKLLTSNILLRRLFLTGYVAGIACQPANVDQNGDFLKVQDTSIQYCRYGISIGNSQSRSVDISDVDMNCVAQPLVNNVHGSQHGKFGGTIRNLSLGQCGEHCNFNTAYSGPTTFENLYTESQFLGAQLTSSETIVYINPELHWNTYINRGIPPAQFTSANSAIQMYGGRITDFPDVIVFNCQKPPRLEGVNMTPSNLPSTLPQYLAWNATAGGLIIMLVSLADELQLLNPVYERWNIDTGSGTNRGNTQPGDFSSRSQPACAYTQIIASFEWYPATSFGRPVYAPINDIAKNVGGLVSVQSGLTLTMTFSTYTPYQFAQQGPLPGDIIVDQDTGTTFRADSKSGQVVTCTQLNNYKYDGAVYSNFSSFSLSTNNWTIYNGRSYMGNTPLLGTATGGTSILTVTDGYGNNVTANGFNPVANDWLAVNPWIDRFADETGAQIQSIDTGAGTYTFTGTNIFQRTLTYPYLLPHWIRWTG